MIDINLIPQSLRNNGKGSSNSAIINIPKETLVGVGVGVVFLLLLVHLVLGLTWLVEIGRLSVSKNKWQALAPDKKTLDDIHSESKELKDQFILISGMTTQKTVVWSPKFNVISDSVSKGLWLRRMVLDKDGLTMEGSVVSKSQNEVANVGLFLSTLKQNDLFMKDFSSLEVNSIQRGKNNSIEVTDFTAIAKLK
jgi:hypothetical protein